MGAGVVSAGALRALLPVRRQDASPKRSAPVPPLDRKQGRVSATHRQIQSSGVNLPAAALGRVPAEAIPAPAGPPRRSRPTTE